MHVQATERGFRTVEHAKYPSGAIDRLLSESSAIGDYEDAMDNPGSSFLWIGNDFHLAREEVQELAVLLRHWLVNKRLPQPE